MNREVFKNLKNIRQTNIEWVKKISAVLEEPPLYARIDLVRDATGNTLLMELELIEPSLYFDQCPEAATRFVDAFLRIHKP